MSVKNAMTSEFLHSAYGGESMAHMRYLIWGDLAEKEGFPNTAKLFRAISFAEQVHATNHYRAIGGETAGSTVTAGGIFGPNKTADNLRGAIMGELHEVEQMYPVYLNTAELQNEPEARRSFHFALEAEKQHAVLYQQALDVVSAGKDIALDSVYICPVCGHTVLNGAPEHCPICGTAREQYHGY
ncbi:MAG: rubrerythrin family protein [Clostridiaceae bacterium]|nr:rubrerythrin family protein [Eubacteriales bacterium]